MPTVSAKVANSTSIPLAFETIVHKRESSMFVSVVATTDLCVSKKANEANCAVRLPRAPYSLVYTKTIDRVLHE